MSIKSFIPNSKTCIRYFMLFIALYFGNQFHGFDGSLHIVHPQDVGPFHERNSMKHRGAVQRPSSAVMPSSLVIIDLRHTYQQRQFKDAEVGQVSHQLIIMIHRFAKTKSRVKNHIFHPMARNCSTFRAK